jgi:signal transduction histidine kinase
MYHETALSGVRDVSTANPPQGNPETLGDSPRESPLFAALPGPHSQLVGNFLDAQEFERFRLGRELHDTTGQLLVALRLSIAHFRSTAGQSPDALSEIEKAAREIEEQIRAFAFLHYPAELSHGGLCASLQGFSRSFARRTGIHVFFRGDGSLPLAAGPAALDLLRVAQEALTNVYRHARATNVRVSIARRQGQVEVSIKDDGRGLPGDDGPLAEGVGLSSMRHRVERHGGHLTVRRRKQGTEILAAVPLAEFGPAGPPA